MYNISSDDVIQKTENISIPGKVERAPGFYADLSCRVRLDDHLSPGRERMLMFP